MADRDTVVPVEVSAVIGFDSPAGFQQRVLAGDGIKTAGQLVDELAGSLVAAGFNFTLRMVQDDDYGDMWELVSQPIPVQMMPTPDRSITIQTRPCWSDYFGTIGISLESPGDSQ